MTPEESAREIVQTHYGPGGGLSPFQEELVDAVAAALAGERQQAERLDAALRAALDHASDILDVAERYDTPGELADALRAALAATPTPPQERRIECASCHKAPTDDPAIGLTRMNVKGVPGVWLCQWCIRPTPPPDGAPQDASGPGEGQG